MCQGSRLPGGPKATHKKMLSQTAKKLKVSRETLRTLERPGLLREVAGATGAQRTCQFKTC